MRRLGAFLAFLIAGVAFAAPVSRDQAKAAVGRWLGLRPSLGCRLGGAVRDVRTCRPGNGAAFHVVRLVGGGFVVTSADTRVEPVVAFSDSDDLVESDANPLWALLKGDLAGRTKALGGAALQSVAPGATARPSDEEARWAKLLAGGPALQGVASVSDVRVEPLVQSKWGQGKNSMYSNWGAPCYNYYTPNNYVCGCVATALAQLLRHHRHPVAPKTVATRTCSVDGAPRSFSMMGGPYAYDDMPLVPEADYWLGWYDGGATEAQRQAIGRLTYDCGVAMQMQWADGAGSSYCGFAFSPLLDVFGYANARSYITASDMDAATRRRVLFASQDARAPVLGGIAGHAVRADGDGYSDGVAFTHLNMGWSGADDAWYSLPSVQTELTGYVSDVVRELVYNVFPDRKGDVLSGRVVDSAGAPVAGAEVSLATATGARLDTVATDLHGVYAFVREVSGSSQSQSFTVTATRGADSVRLTQVRLYRGASPRSVNLQTGAYDTRGMQAGNSWGNDLVLPGLAATETSTTEVPVPYAWLDAAFPGPHTGAEYEALARADADGDGFAAWEEYLCGTDPSDAADFARCEIGMRAGAPHVTHNVAVPLAAAKAGWRMRLLGSDDLQTWTQVGTSEQSGKRFFKVRVEKP